MTDISPAALPPIHGTFTAEDEKHARFPEYRVYRHSMIRLLVEAASFKNWLSCKEREEAMDAEADHPRFKDWQGWYRDNRKGGTQMLPNGQPNAFPHNFRLWLAQGPW